MHLSVLTASDNGVPMVSASISVDYVHCQYLIRNSLHSTHTGMHDGMHYSFSHLHSRLLRFFLEGEEIASYPTSHGGPFIPTTSTITAKTYHTFHFIFHLN